MLTRYSSVLYKVGHPTSKRLVCYRKTNPFSSPKDCLVKNSYQEDRCREQIIALYKCCNSFYQENGDQARTPSCPRPDLLKLKLQQYGEK